MDVAINFLVALVKQAYTNGVLIYNDKESGYMLNEEMTTYLFNFATSKIVRDKPNGLYSRSYALSASNYEWEEVIRTKVQNLNTITNLHKGEKRISLFTFLPTKQLERLDGYDFGWYIKSTESGEGLLVFLQAKLMDEDGVVDFNYESSDNVHKTGNEQAINLYGHVERERDEEFWKKNSVTINGGYIIYNFFHESDDLYYIPIDKIGATRLMLAKRFGKNLSEITNAQLSKELCTADHLLSKTFIWANMNEFQKVTRREWFKKTDP